jgi:hypothetical protein
MLVKGTYRRKPIHDRLINQDNVKGKVSCGSLSGKILPIDLTEFQGKFICQKKLSFAEGVSVGIEFSKKLGRGFFGGEGFIMQKIEETGICTLWRNLKERTKSRRSPESRYGCIVGFTKDVDYDIEFIGGIKTPFSVEKVCSTPPLRGPGTVYIQSLPFSRLADRIIASAPKSRKSRGEGSVLGGLGNLLMEIIVINFIIQQHCNHKLDLPTRTGSHHSSTFILLKSLTKQQRPPEMGVVCYFVVAILQSFPKSKGLVLINTCKV